MPQRPRLVLISTGGTIAGQAGSPNETTGYQAGALDPDALLAAVPGHEAVASVTVTALMAIDSKDMTPQHWLVLARAIAAHLAQPECDGVVVTHGTDTLEETAWLLHLLTPPGKPVVLTAAMRPATALSADGPMNLYQALRVAACPDAWHKGVLVVMNDRILAAQDIAKHHTLSLDAISAGEAGALGNAVTLRFDKSPDLRHAGVVGIDALSAGAAFPRVDILYVAAGSDPEALRDSHHGKVPGLVLALPGNGSLPETWADAARVATSHGVKIVRASRVPFGPVTPDPKNDSCTTPAGNLNPVKARITLMLELATGIPGLFERIATQAR